MRKFLKLISAVLLCSASSALAGVVLQPTQAPEWEVAAWINEDPGSLGDHRGQLVLIEFFQLWCPGATEFSIPLYRRWNALYGDREDVAIVFVHSVFEGHDYQTPQRLREFVREHGIVHPVGIDAYDDTDEAVPVTMRRYETGGTPHLAIVDRQGMLRFTHFGTFDPKPVEAFIERLLKEPLEASQPTLGAAPRPARSREGPDHDLSGTYAFRTEPASGACATWIPRMELPAELRFYRDSIDVDFTRPFLGTEAMELLYDPETGRVEGESQSTARNLGPNRVLRLAGMLDRQADPPQLEFELSILDGRCTVQGRAQREP